MATEKSLEKSENVEESRKKVPQKVKELKAPCFPIQTLIFQGRVISLDFQVLSCLGPVWKRKRISSGGGGQKVMPKYHLRLEKA